MGWGFGARRPEGLSEQWEWMKMIELQNYNVFGVIETAPGERIKITMWSRFEDDDDESGYEVYKLLDPSADEMGLPKGTVFFWYYRLTEPVQHIIYYYACATDPNSPGPETLRQYNKSFDTTFAEMLNALAEASETSAPEYYLFQEALGA